MRKKRLRRQSKEDVALESKKEMSGYETESMCVKVDSVKQSHDRRSLIETSSFAIEVDEWRN